MTRRWWWLAALMTVVPVLLGLLSGCTPLLRANDAWDVDQHEGILLEVSDYYHRHAAEEGGRCRAPMLDGVVSADITEESDEAFNLELRYYYRDFIRYGGACAAKWDPKQNPGWRRKWRPLRCSIDRECSGIASRRFEIAKAGVRFNVLNMTGDRRH